MTSSAENLICGEELLALTRERLAAGQNVRYLPFRGFSMLPLLRQGKDAVELSPLPDRLKKYDLPVYQYPSGKVVMHRVVAVRDDHYICLGDNTYQYETLRHDQMIGLVSTIRRGDTLISTDDPRYLLYSKFWVGIYPLRKLLRPGWVFFRRAVGFIRRRLK